MSRVTEIPNKGSIVFGVRVFDEDQTVYTFVVEVQPHENIKEEIWDEFTGRSNKDATCTHSIELDNPYFEIIGPDGFEYYGEAPLSDFVYEGKRTYW